MRMEYLRLMVAKKNVKEGQCVDPHVGGAGFIGQGENNSCSEEMRRTASYCSKRFYHTPAQGHNWNWFYFFLSFLSPPKRCMPRERATLLADFLLSRTWQFRHNWSLQQSWVAANTS